MLSYSERIHVVYWNSEGFFLNVMCLLVRVLGYSCRRKGDVLMFAALFAAPSHSSAMQSGSSRIVTSNGLGMAVSASVGVKAHAQFVPAPKGKAGSSRSRHAERRGGEGGVGRGIAGGASRGGVAGGKAPRQLQNGPSHYTAYPAPEEASLPSGAFEDWEYDQERQARQPP